MSWFRGYIGLIEYPRRSVNEDRTENGEAQAPTKHTVMQHLSYSQCVYDTYFIYAQSQSSAHKGLSFLMNE